jgi:hypothetical protein
MSLGSAGNAAALGAADWLRLAATPTFALMALVTAPGSGPPDGLCSAAQGASPVSGMVAMYLLMSAFHSTPWLKLMSRRGRVAVRKGGDARGLRPASAAGPSSPAP